MTDKHMYHLLTRFGNEHTLAKDINVVIKPECSCFTPLNDEGANYEDVVLLGSLIKGAYHFLMWARRKKVKL